MSIDHQKTYHARREITLQDTDRDWGGAGPLRGPGFGRNRALSHPTPKYVHGAYYSCKSVVSLSVNPNSSAAGF